LRVRVREWVRDIGFGLSAYPDKYIMYNDILPVMKKRWEYKVKTLISQDGNIKGIIRERIVRRVTVIKIIRMADKAMNRKRNNNRGK